MQRNQVGSRCCGVSDLGSSPGVENLSLCLGALNTLVGLLYGVQGFLIWAWRCGFLLRGSGCFVGLESMAVRFRAGRLGPQNP